MNKYVVLSLALVAALSSGCRNHYQGEVVKETYIHKYGVPVSAADWEKQGKDGQVIQLQKDGVTAVHTYDKGILHGESTWSFPNSQTVQRVEIYENGVLVGKRDHYTSGTPQQEEHFAGRFVTKRMRWYEDGTPAATENFQNGLMLSAEYRTPLNVVESRIQDGNGTRYCRNNDGEMMAKDLFENGQLTERMHFFPNGDPSDITPYVNGQVHGKRLTFLRGGLPKSVETWNQGQQEGITVVYQNGEKSAEVPYVNGKKNGIELRYRDGSMMVEEITWIDNEQHGPHRIFVDGSTKVEWYHQGEVVSRPTFERLNPPTR